MHGRSEDEKDGEIERNEVEEEEEETEMQERKQEKTRLFEKLALLLKKHESQENAVAEAVKLESAEAEAENETKSAGQSNPVNTTPKSITPEMITNNDQKQSEYEEQYITRLGEVLDNLKEKLNKMEESKIN